jgi:hypothetical protein
MSWISIKLFSIYPSRILKEAQMAVCVYACAGNDTLSRRMLEFFIAQQLKDIDPLSRLRL